MFFAQNRLTRSGIIIARGISFNKTSLEGKIYMNFQEGKL